MGTMATIEKAGPANSSADTVAFVMGRRLVGDCVGPQLAGQLPGLNLRVLERAEDLIELGDWCSVSLIVLWIDGHGMDYETAFEAALEAARKRPIAVLSDFADPALVSRALTNGVRAYFTSSMSLTELAGAIRFVITGGTFVPPSALGGMTTEPAFLKNDGLDAQLSPRQLEVLELLHHGKQNKIIAYELGMAEATVKVHVRMIMKKLNARNRLEVIVKTKSSQQSSIFEMLSKPHFRKLNAAKPTSILRDPPL